MNEETIPEDIQRRARQVLNMLADASAVEDKLAVIQSAILAERERCAKIAEAHKRVQTTLSGPGAAKLTAQSIAFDIRNPQ